jgi:hypothetical protein
MNRDPMRTMCVLFGLCAAAMAQSNWSLMGLTGPSPRGQPGLAFDSQRGCTVLFGGLAMNATGPVTLGDTWEWDGAVWSQRRPVTAPPPRFGHAMVHDSARNRTVLYGGSTDTDTWEWDGIHWARVSTVGPPSTYGHAMTFDSSRGRTVLYGGAGAGGSDTWEWDGFAWTQVATGMPLARMFSAMAFDSVRNRVVMFGGTVDQIAGLGETWEWDGTTWMLMAANGPPRRMAHAMTYDRSRRVTVLCGGIDHNPAQIIHGDDWEWDGSTWTSGATAAPFGPRTSAALAYDSARRRAVLFGGETVNASGAVFLGDTWEGSGTPIAQALPFGTGCGSPPLTLTPAVGAPPGIGATAQAALSNVPTPVAFVALGWSQTTFGQFALPLYLGGFGIPCYLLQSADVSSMASSPTGPSAAAFRIAIPDVPWLVGVHVYAQAWAPAPLANSGQTVVSNGIDWQIGY